MKIINVTAHPIRFQRHHHEFVDGVCMYCGLDSSWYASSCEAFYEVQPCGTVISATVKEIPVGNHPSGASLIETIYTPSKEAEEALTKLEKENPNAVIVGSIIAAQAFPGRVYGLVPYPGFERTDKRMRDDKFIVFHKPKTVDSELNPLEIGAEVLRSKGYKVSMAGFGYDSLCVEVFDPNGEKVYEEWFGR